MTDAPRPMRVALYARVSRREDQNPENQFIRLRAFAVAQGWTVQGEYEDRISGVKDNRPALDKLRAAARARWVDVVVVVRLDRLGRSVLHLREVSEEFKRYKVRFVALDQNIDTESPMGMFYFTLLSAFAELEREFIRERTKDGLARVRAEGRRIGKHRRFCDCGLMGTIRFDGKEHQVKHDGVNDLMPGRSLGRQPRSRHPELRKGGGGTIVPEIFLDVGRAWQELKIHA